MKAKAHSATEDGQRDASAGGLAGPRLTPKQREKQRLRQRALQLRSEGKTFAEIADELGWSGPSGASYAVKMARKELRESGPIENAEELWRLNYERLEAMLRMAWPYALGGMRNGEHVAPDPKFMDVVRRIIADMGDLLPNVQPDEVGDRSTSTSNPSATEPAGSPPILVVEFDEDRLEAARRKFGSDGHSDLVSVDHQPPAGDIAPRATDTDTDTDPESVGMEPNSVNPETSEPVFDPRVAIRLD